MESSGDPWLENSNASSRPYFLFVYFLTVTMSTVGYGDVLVYTVSGQFLITVFIFIYLVRPPSFLPPSSHSLCSIMSVPGSSTVSSTGHVCKLHSPGEGDPSKPKALQWKILQCLGEIVSHLSIQGRPIQSPSPDSHVLQGPSLFLCLTLMFCVCVCVAGMWWCVDTFP